MQVWPAPVLALLICFVLVGLLVLILTTCKVGNRRRVTFQENVEESEVVEIETENYGTAGNKVSEGWCERETECAGEEAGQSDLEMEKAEAMMLEETLQEKKEKENVISDEEAETQNETNIELEKAAMMAIKEQSIELERFEAGGSKPKSGMMKVLERFPFLKNFGTENEKTAEDSVLTEATSKPDILENDLPSYSEVVKDPLESEIDKKIVKPTDDLMEEDSSNILQEDQEDSAAEMETTEKKNDDQEEAKEKDEVLKQQEERLESQEEKKRSRFRFSFFTDKK